MPRVSPEVLYLSALIRTKDQSHPVKAGLTEDHFDGYKIEWKWIESFIRRHGKTPSKLAVTTKFPEFKLYRTDDLDHWADQIHDAHTRRAVIEMITASADKVGDGNINDAIQLMTAGAKRLTMIAQATSIRETSILDDYELLLETVTSRQQRLKDRGSAGVTTGFPTIDDVSGGLQPSELWVFGARLGVGKSWVLMALAAHAVMNGDKVLYHALEQSRQQVAMRVGNIMSGGVWKASELHRGIADLKAYRAFLKGLKESVKSQMIVSDKPKITPEYLAGSIERNKPDVVIVDYLSLMRTTRAGASKDWQNVGELSDELKSLSTEYEIPVATASQITRGGGMTDKKIPPGTEHLAFADIIGQNADGVVTMSRRSDSVIAALLAKYRHGRDGQRFNIEFMPGAGVIQEISANRAGELVEIDASMMDDEDD